ncbi:DUF4382 domain-containing protein [Vibrio alginolyticus]|uniref:DUF4382 domain-containing protein n=1 Tax=Vibrio alginolyticus TaxID=663 RepID=UPI001BD20C48|nr:DUF4382 domain-containing protein [Vibrio alginolyticus]MBS9903865.1 DUF4382 domain-containing protein [Vibrio alginolyticus]MBS9931332.1 DUF4382 domain-containing protein [Vibrio alginolyticus]MBS9982494.1 DUF4382 domain-containing protein [Vibrio alginolyticus]
MNSMKIGLISASITVALIGCNSDSDSVSTMTPVTLSVSDAPIDDVSEVVIAYNKVAFLPLDGGTPQVFDVYKTDEDGNFVDENGNPLLDNEDPIPLSVNLLDFQGSNAQELVDDELIPTGNYKLCVFANDGDHPDYPSYVVDEATGNQIPLTVKGNGACPQGVGTDPNSGVLFFNDTFAVNPDNNEFVVEFDLRRGLKDGTGQNEGYSIQRTSVTLINTVTTGEIQGDIATLTYQNCETDTPSANGYAHAVYLYEGNIAEENMGPFAGAEGQIMPIAAANVVEDIDEANYEYEFGFVEPGTYSVGYTCTANDDSVDGIVASETFSIYQSTSGISVFVGTDTNADF